MGRAAALSRGAAHSRLLLVPVPSPRTGGAGDSCGMSPAMICARGFAGAHSGELEVISGRRMAFVLWLWENHAAFGLHGL